MDERLTAFLTDAIEAAGFPVKTMDQRRRPDADGDGFRMAHGDALSAQSRGISHHPSRPCVKKTSKPLLLVGSEFLQRVATEIWIESSNEVHAASSGTHTKQPEAGSSCCRRRIHSSVTPLPGAQGVEFVIHVAPQLGARFTQMTAEFGAGGMLGPTPAQRLSTCLRVNSVERIGPGTRPCSGRILPFCRKAPRTQSAHWCVARRAD